ncbi:MAG: hypothetical protein ACSHYA_06540 [Opitutaceae bacterium]
MSFRNFILLILALTSSYQAHSQAASDEQQLAYLVQLLYLGSPSISPDQIDNGISFNYSGGSDFFQINAMPGELTRTLKYRGSSQMALYAGGQPVTEESQPKLLTELGASGSKVVLITQSATGKLASKVLDVRSGNFAPNTVRVLNFSDQPIRAKVDQEVRSLKPMAANDFPIKDKRARFLIRLAIAGQNDDEVYLIEKRRLAMRQGERKLLLLHNQQRDPDEVTYSMYSIPIATDVENYSDDEYEKIDPRDYEESAYSSGPGS